VLADLGAEIPCSNLYGWLTQDAELRALPAGKHREHVPGPGGMAGWEATLPGRPRLQGACRTGPGGAYPGR
jgi:hypothetical protein